MRADRAVVAVVGTDGIVHGAAAFRIDSDEDRQHAVEFVTDGIQPGDELRWFLHGENVRLSEPPPAARPTPSDRGDER